MAYTTHDLISGSHRALRVGVLAIVTCLGAVLVMVGAVVALASTAGLSLTGVARIRRSAPPQADRPAPTLMAGPERLAALRQELAHS